MGEREEGGRREGGREGGERGERRGKRDEKGRREGGERGRREREERGRRERRERVRREYKGRTGERKERERDTALHTYSKRTHSITYYPYRYTDVLTPTASPLLL